MRRIVNSIGLLLIALALISCQDDTPSQVSEPATQVAAAPAEVAVKTYTAESFFETTSFIAASSAGNAFNGSGSSVLVSSDESGVFNVYSVDIESGQRTQLTESDGTANIGLSFFPGDDRVLFTADQGGDELNHIWVRELNGQVADLTPGENVKAQFVGWTKDGGSFFVTTNERDAKAFDLYRYQADGYARELAFENTQAFQPGALDPTGRWLALIKPRTAADANVYLADLSTEAPPQLITEHEGNIAYSVYDFTPDSSELVLATNEHGEWNQAWSYDIATGEKTPYVTADWDVSFVGFSKTGRYRMSGVNAQARTELSIFDHETGSNVDLPDLPRGNVLFTRFSADDTQLAFLLNGDASPSDLYVLNMRSAQVKRLTHALNPAIEPSHLVEATDVRYPSFDGLEIPSVLYKPLKATALNKVPAVVLVHGGPGGQTRHGYRALVQHLVNHGYAVLGANNRGSSGYGKTFFHMDDKQHGEADLKDIVWGRKYLETLDWIDPTAIGVIGGSYGGYITVAALTYHPDAFDAGIDIFGVTNWVRTLESIPPWWESFREALYDEMGDPATDAERHRAISPLFHADRITKPLLVVQGANDPRVLQVESDEIVEAVRANGVPVDYLLFDDEGHGFRNRNNRIAASNAYLKFLQQHMPGAQ